MSQKWITVNARYVAILKYYVNQIGKYLCRLQSGIQLIHQITLADFKTILYRVTERNSSELFNPDELKKFEANFELDENNIHLLIHSIAYIFKQSCRFILKPTVLEKQLVEDLKFQQDKVKAFVQLWTSETKKNFGNFEDWCHLEDVSWQLNVQTASSTCNKESIPNAKIQMNLSKVKDETKDSVALELNEEELVQLYTTLENIQTKLDAVNTSRQQSTT